MGGSKAQYAVVGAFVLLMVGALLLGLVRLSGWTADTDAYFAVFSNVTGVNEGTKVFYEGYPVGRVAEIEPLSSEEAARLADPAKPPAMTRFRLELEIEQGWQIAHTAKAELVAPGFLSAVIVSIDEGTVDEGESIEPLPPGSVIPSRRRQSIQTILRNLGGRADVVADSLESLIATTEATIIERVNPTIEDVRKLAHVVAQDVPKIIAKADSLTDDIQTLIDEARGFTSAGNREQVATLLEQLGAASADLRRVTGNANTLIDEARALLAANRPDVDRSVDSLRYVMDALARDIDTINRNLEGTSRNMYEFSRQIRRNPGVLLGGTKPGDR